MKNSTVAGHRRDVAERSLPNARKTPKRRHPNQHRSVQRRLKFRPKQDQHRLLPSPIEQQDDFALRKVVLDAQQVARHEGTGRVAKDDWKWSFERAQPLRYIPRDSLL